MCRPETLPGLVSLVAWFALIVAPPASARAQSGDYLYDASGGRLELRIDERLDETERREMHHWISTISDTLAAVYGHWPRRHWRVSIQATTGATTDPIPWAQVDRGEVDEVRFYVVASTPGDQLIREWTGYHELAHLLIPYRGWGDTWFSEGLASYYQNLMQARSGVINEQQMWQKLHDGFRRGRDDHRYDGQTLQTVSARLRSHGGFMRVYWSGAWYFLAADLELRSATDGNVTLDLALARLNRCCADRSMSVAEMIRALDRMNGVQLFSRLYDQAVTSTAVPDFESLYGRLGLRIIDGRVSLGGDAGQVTLRAGFIEPPRFQSL